MPTTPLTIDPTVLAFCGRVSPAASPTFVSVVPEAYARANFCNFGVERKVASNGGEAVPGWVIWADDQIIEAECHMVWRAPSGGGLVDITPKPDGESRILFLPEPGLWDGSRPVPNRILARVDTSMTRGLVARGRLYEALRKRHWKGGGAEIPLNEHREMQRALGSIIEQSAQPNAFCPCQSGLRFKKCCGAPSGTPRSFGL